MAFLEEFGIFLNYFIESNHGEPENLNCLDIIGGTEEQVSAHVEVTKNGSKPTQLKLVSDPILKALQSPDFIVTPNSSTSADTKSTLQFGSTIFGEKSVSIAKGFYATIDKEQDDVVNLYLYVVKGDDLRVAQVMADTYLNFKRNKCQHIKGTLLFLNPGVHSLDIEYIPEYYFLSTHTF